MKEIKSEIEIKAPAETVWNVLMDFDHYSEWNPFIKSIAGHKSKGGQINVFIQPPGEKGMTFKPRVIEHKKQQEFRWLGKLWGGLFFNGEHYFLLEDKGNGITQFTHGEKFTGILVGIMSSLLKNTKSGFEEMNIALKEKCELP
jgi:hypothetical protein